MALDTSVYGANGTSIASAANPVPVTPGTSAIFNVRHDDTAFARDGFHRLRVSTPTPVFEYAFANDLIATMWEGTAYGAGSKTQNTTSWALELNTTTAINTGYWLQSYNHIRYQAGVSTLFRMTFTVNETTANLRHRIGMFTDQGTFPSTAGDGFFFEVDGTTLAVVRRTLTGGGVGSEERVTQANWNKDTLTGAGASGVTLDITKAQQLVVDYQWHGVGAIRFGFEINHDVIWVHQFTNSNVLTSHWSRTGTLPVRAECYTTGATAVAGKLILYACSVMQEGNVDNRSWRQFGGTSGTAVRTGGTAVGLYPLVSLRALLTNDITKRTTFVPTSASIVVTVAMTTSLAAQWALLMIPAPLTGATFAGTAGASSSVGVDQAATASTAVTGTTIASGVLPVAVGTYNIDLKDLRYSMMRAGQNAAGGLTITGANVLCLAYGPLVTAAGAGASAVASINWQELT